MVELLNNQINEEFYSAYLYLDFANYYKEKKLDEFANWYNLQDKKKETMQYYSSSIFKTTMRKWPLKQSINLIKSMRN